MVQLSQAPFRCPSSPSGRSEEGEDKSMKAAKQQVNPSGESQPPSSPLQSALNSAASPSQAYETYIDNGLICLKHKIRNIEKKKLKLEDYKDRLKKGEALNQDQLEAVEKYDEVVHNLEFAKELQKTFSGLSQDLLKAQRKAQRRESLLKLEAEKKKLRTILQVQYVLQNFTQEHVQKDFKGGVNGAIYLPSKELDYLIRFAKLTCPERNENLSVEDQMEQSSLYFWDLLEGSEKPVVGTTYKHMKDLLSKLLDSGYFESIPTPRTTVPVKELEEEINRKSERTRQMSKGESVKEPESIMELMKSEIQPQEFLNRRYLPEAEYSVKKKPEEPKSWEAECARKQEPPKSWEMLVDIEEQEQKPKQETLKPWEARVRQQEPKRPDSPKPWEARVKEEEQKRESTKPWETRVEEEEQKKQEAPKAWVARVREEQESPKPWVAKVREEQDQKKQESPKPWVAKVREEQEQKKQESPKPWVTKVKEEPEQKQESPKPWVTQTREQPEQKKPEPVKSWEMPVREEQQQLSSQQLQNPPKSWGAASVGPKEQMGPKKFDMEPKEVPKPVHQPAAEFCSTSTLPKDPVLRREKLQDLMTQIQGTYNFMQESILDFDKASPSAIGPSQPPSVTAASSPVASKEQKLPSQSDFLQQPLQVFKVNAPLPPRKDQETKEDSSYSAGYNQSFSTASTQTPPQCQLQSSHVAEQTSLSQESLSSAVNYQPDGAVPVSNGSLAFYPAQTNVIPRPPQPYLNSRGSVRGSARGGRSLANSYRSPGGYKGFDAYRGSPSITNGNYGQLQFPGRDYAGMPYSQRDVNYQQCYKRGGITSGPRANSRAGWSDSSQVSSPERDNETFNSGDSGQGDSRSITPVDMPVTSQAATILPVHVYPLPQQMRVAFSAARTSNLAPGTLDQPIVFDLLLNNLGETFDIQLGRFNCPVNGTYVFIFHMLKLAVNVPLYVNLMKNEEVLVSAYANDGAPDHETASNHAVLQLFQGDQIWLRLHRGAIYGSSWKYSTFSGYLLYQD
ncbi:caprin-2 isoform X5 [Gymnogyps californianus]|uniref:caprin-2 isoform X5 n=1 Tax=Gymnogyps californianus TaxID=33616 RepID=UPI0021C583C3|nr:caprin-2 isoform X5 [Gymnogyps californianus]